MQFLEDAFKKSTELAEQFRNARDEAVQRIQEMYEEVHAVFGTAAEPLKSRTTGEVVAETGQRVVLLYPQTQEDGKTWMRIKTVDSVTAKISLHAVCVYDPTSSSPSSHRKVTDFSCVA
jgi:uncharacterized protein YhaN